MYNFWVIKKRNALLFFFILFIIFTLVISASYFFITKKASTTFNQFSDSEIDAVDLDNDGYNDSISINPHNTSYIIKIITASKEYLLRSSNNTYELFDSSTCLDVKVKLLDLTRDNIPEIIISGLKNNTYTTYIFTWTGNNFINTLTSTKNLCGILNSKNSKTPYVIDAQSNIGNNSTSANILLGEKVKDITFSTPKIPSLGKIQNFIDLVQLPYELSETPNLFTDYIPSTELGLLWNLDKNKYRYNFQGGFFNDISWNNSGVPSTILWTLAFEKVDLLDSSKKNMELKLGIQVDLDESGEYMISSIKKLN